MLACGELLPDASGSRVKGSLLEYRGEVMSPIIVIRVSKPNVDHIPRTPVEGKTL